MNACKALGFSNYLCALLKHMNKRLLLLASFFVSTSVFAQTEPDTSKTLPDSLENKVPIFTVTASDVDNDIDNQDYSALLQSSRDVFVNMAGYNLSAGRFRIRGLSGENQLVMINGIPVNNLETGLASWSNWGGLNDVTRFTEVRVGVTACRYNFGGVGGFTNIDSRASSFRKSTKFSYALTNRNYHHRVMFTQSTGMNEKGWAFTYALSARYAKEGYYEGSFFNAGAYYLSVDKKVNDKHLLSFVGFGAPIQQGRQGFALQETYNLAGTNYYNPNWGYQTLADGSGQVKRNARVSNQHKPTVLLTDYYNFDLNTSLTTTIFGSYTFNKLSNLNWYDTKDPRPDYYRYLPSYYALTNPSYAEELTSLWENDMSVRQINWDGLYSANNNNLYTLYNANGVEGNTLNGKRSKYIVENAHMNALDYGLNSVFNKRINNIYLTAGVNATLHKGYYFKTMQDLLGGDFWLDIDQFAEQQFADPNSAQNDLNNPNRVIYEGDRFGYDYILNVNKVEAFGQVEYTFSKFDVYAALNLGNTSMWRTGNYQNGRFPQNSFGDSEKLNFFTYGAKGGVAYKITGRHVVSINAAYVQRAPDSRSVYVSPRTSNNLVSDLENEKVTAGDISYQILYPKFKARLTGFYTAVNGQVWYRSYYHDTYNNFVNYVMTNVDQLMTGFETGVEASITSSLVFQAGFSMGKYLWNSRPQATITRDNSAQELATNRTIYMKNYHIGNMPETAGSAGFKYNGKKFWFAGVNFNYFADFYAEPNPDRRTEEAVSTYVTDDPQWNQLLNQEKLPNNHTIDVYGGKSFQFKRKYTLNINASINNILNNQTIVNLATEQLRYDAANPLKFPNKYAYSMGINYFLMVSFRF